jgi:hypothetical protein
MRLSAIVAELQSAAGPVTGFELADRLGITTTEVAAMLVALRASGRLAPEPRDPQPATTCSSSGSCSLSCPGPDNCALTVDLSVTGLQIRSVR